MKIAAHSLLEPFNHCHRNLVNEQRSEDSWEDSMLVNPGLESSGELRIVHCQPSRSAMVALTDSLSFRLLLKTFQRTFSGFTGFSVTDGIRFL